MVANGPERLAREARIKSSMNDLEKDTLAKKTMLRLELASKISSDVDKGKGRVFNFEASYHKAKVETNKLAEQKLLASTIKSGLAMSRVHVVDCLQSGVMAANFNDVSSFFQEGSTVYRIGFSEAGSSGTLMKKKNTERDLINLIERLKVHVNLQSQF